MIDFKADRTGWPSGPWDNEPDYIEPFDLPGGMVGCCFRGHATWCGYVALPVGHPLDGAGYGDVDYGQVDPHGGLTFDRRLETGWRIFGDRPDLAGRWVFGFDCNHYGDGGPHRSDYDTIYRSASFTRREVERLAAQLAAYRVGGVE